MQCTPSEKGSYYITYNTDFYLFFRLLMGFSWSVRKSRKSESMSFYFTLYVISA